LPVAAGSGLRRRRRLEIAADKNRTLMPRR
jgi:hypothetical protein